MTTETHTAKEAILIFTRFPVPGQAKTRLVPSLGKQGAAELQRSMTEHTLAEAMVLKQSTSVDIEIFYEGGARMEMEEWLGTSLSFRTQHHGDLGIKILDALNQGFEKGYHNIIVIGTDCPALSSSVISEGFKALTASDVVIGPASDGGFYLLGVKKPPAPSLFEMVSWGEDTVCASVCNNAASLHLSVYCLQQLSDIDRPEDLIHLHEEGKKLLSISVK